MEMWYTTKKKVDSETKLINSIKFIAIETYTDNIHNKILSDKKKYLHQDLYNIHCQ